MKFEKLTDSKIRVIFTEQDMRDNNVSPQKFFADKCISQQVLQVLLVNAEKEIGFKAEDSKLLVEAIAVSDGGIVFTITKLSSLKKEVSSNLICKFETFDDFLDLCTYIKNLNNIELKNISKDISLILFNNIYYLYIPNQESLVFYNWSNILSDFGEIVSYSPKIDGTLHEYGKFIYKNNAIKKCLNLIK